MSLPSSPRLLSFDSSRERGRGLPASADTGLHLHYTEIRSQFHNAYSTTSEGCFIEVAKKRGD